MSKPLSLVLWFLAAAAAPAGAEVQFKPSHQGALYQAYLDYSLGGAEEGLTRALKLAGESSFLVLEQAELAGRRGDPRAMLELAEKAARIDPSNTAAHELIARTCFRLVEAGLSSPDASLSNGIEHAEAYVGLGGTDDDVYEMLVQAHAWSARIAQARGDRAEVALHDAARRRTLETWVDRLHQDRARELLLDFAREQGDEELEAHCLVEKLALTPQDASIAQRLGELLRRLGRCEEAVDLLAEAATWPGTDDLTSIGIGVNLAKCANEVGLHDDARTAARKALELDPTNLLAAGELAEAWLALGDAQQAADAWESVSNRLGQRRSPASGLASVAATRRTSYLEARARWELSHDLHDQATAHAKEALALLPSGGAGSEEQRSDLQELVGSILLDQGKAADCETFARAVLQAEPGSISGAITLADALWLAGRGNDASAALADFAKGPSGSRAEFLLRSARWNLARGFQVKAAELARAALKAIEESAPEGKAVPVGALSAVGETLHDAGQPQEGEVLLRRALVEGGADTDVTYLLADALQEQGRAAEAAALLDDVPGAKTDAYVMARRSSWENAHHMPDKGLATARAAVAERAAQGGATTPLVRSRFLALEGDALLQARQNEEAAARLREAADLRPRPDRGISLTLARALGRAGRPLEGLAALDKLPARHPPDSGLAAERIRLLIGAGRKEEGVALALSLVDQVRWSPGVHRQAALVLDDTGALEAARQVADLACQRFPQDPLTWLVSGSLHEKRGELDRAEADFRRVLEIDPRSAAGHNALGYMLADHSLRLDEAVKLLKEATALAPHEASYLDSLGWAYFRQGKLAEAATTIESALTRDRDPVLVMHLATVREAQGRAAEALALYQEALRFGLTEDVARVQQRVGELASRVAP